MTDASRCESLIQDLCETLNVGPLICNNLLTGICDDFVNICDAEEFDERNSLELPASGLKNKCFILQFFYLSHCRQQPDQLMYV